MEKIILKEYHVLLVLYLDKFPNCYLFNSYDEAIIYIQQMGNVYDNLKYQLYFLNLIGEGDVNEEFF